MICRLTLSVTQMNWNKFSENNGLSSKRADKIALQCSASTRPKIVQDLCYLEPLAWPIRIQ